MKCSKCGETCKPNQAFCIKCGSPLQVVPDLNLIEAELASNVGKFLGEEKDTEENGEGISVEDKLEDFIEDDENTDIVKGQLKNSTMYNPEKPDGDDNKSNNKKKKKIIIISIITVVILIVIALIAVKLVLDKKANSFEGRYDKGIELYSEGSYEPALEELLVADSLAQTDDEKIKAKKALWDTYTKIGGKDQEIIEILKQLIELEPKEVDYYKALAKLYTDNGMHDEAAQFINSIENEEIQNALSGYGIPAPKASVEAGNYDKFITVELAGNNAEHIYYTLDGSDPTTDSTLYESPININQEGTTVLKAIAVSSDSIQSCIMEQEYKITLGQLPAPEVTPESGNYTEDTKITITAYTGAKIYYTLDGNTPTSNSTLYSEPIDMPSGNNVLKVIAINDKGVTSEVVTNIYNLVIPETYSTSSNTNWPKKFWKK